VDTSLEIGICTMIGTLGGGILGFFGSVFTTSQNAKSSIAVSEKSRLFELYKVIYPEKYNAIKDVMTKANKLLEACRCLN
jgi:hypothetical protein